MRFHPSGFGLFWPCEMTWTPAKEVFRSHFRRRTQIETFPTNRAGHGHLDLSRCLGLFPFQGREGLYTQYTAPSHPTLYHRQSQGSSIGSLFPHFGTGLFTPATPFRCVPFGLSGRGSKLGITGPGSSLASSFLPFLCLGLCFWLPQKALSWIIFSLLKNCIAELASDFIPQLPASHTTVLWSQTHCEFMSCPAVFLWILWISVFSRAQSPSSPIPILHLEEWTGKVCEEQLPLGNSCLQHLGWEI